METPVNIQNSFFNQARKDRAKVVVYLANGTKLVGRIKSFDKFTVILESGTGDQMIFKHAISTVSAHRSFGNYIPMEKTRAADARSSEAKAETVQASSPPDSATPSSSGSEGS
jgi:host factor-I protein